MANFIFYCNGTKLTGFGHLSRCLNIARAISSIKHDSHILFFGEFDRFSCERIAKFGFKVASKHFVFVDNMTVIADSYHLSFSSLFELKATGINLCIIDDFDQYNYDFLDLIINFRFNAETLCNVTPAHRLGLRYFSFAQELRPLRQRRLGLESINTNKIKTILVFIGGDDRFDVANKVVHALDRLLIDKEIILLDRHTRSIFLKNNAYKSLAFIDDMSVVYQQADLIINGGGLTKYEAGFCLIPNCAVSQTYEQLQDTLELAKAHLTFDLGLAESATIESLAENIRQFMHTEIKLQRNAMKTFYKQNSTEQLAQEIIKVSNE